MTRRAATRWQGFWRALLGGALAVLLSGPGPARAEAVELSIPLARGLAEAAIRSGDFALAAQMAQALDRKSTRLNSSHYS